MWRLSFNDEDNHEPCSNHLIDKLGLIDVVFLVLYFSHSVPHNMNSCFALHVSLGSQCGILPLRVVIGSRIKGKLMAEEN